MALGTRLELRQGQSLVITPQLQQAIKLLQLSNLELEAFIDSELEKNPLLSREEREDPKDRDSAPDDAPVGDRFDEAPGGTAAAELDARHDDLYADAAPGDRATGDAGEVAQAATQGGGEGGTDWSRATRSGSFDTDGEGFEGSLSRDKTLAEHLEDQALLCAFTPPERAIAFALIAAVDEGGYLRTTTGEVAARLACAEVVVERVLTRCQGFEPTGVFARDVPECLRLQLVERDRCDPAMEALLLNLDLLARRDMTGLRRVCGVDDEDLRDMIGELRALTPRPGAAFGTETVAAVVPDVMVREDKLLGWRVELNTDTLPRVLVDQRYHTVVSRGARSETEKTFVADCLASASWLVKSLDQRARTILKVSSEIVRQQDAFLAFGVEHLRPLNLKTVADAIGMHESTVSRVTSNKYIATPRGVFELKFFLTSAIASSDGGEAHSAEAVRHKIRTLIESERQGADVLSDDHIVEILKETGIDIARRTVAKYREALRIPSSLDRKRALREAC